MRKATIAFAVAACLTMCFGCVDKPFEQAEQSSETLAATENELSLEDMLAEEARQLLTDKATFDELKERYGLAPRWEAEPESDYLFTESSEMHRVQFDFTRDWDHPEVFRLSSIRAPADILLREYFDTPLDLLPFTLVQSEGVTEGYDEMHDEQFIYSFEIREYDTLERGNQVTICELTTRSTTQRNGRVAEQLHAQAKELLAEKPSFDELNEQYGLEITGGSSLFLYSKIESMPDVEFHFYKDETGQFRLTQIAAPASVLLPEYIRVAPDEIPLPLTHNNNVSFRLTDGQYTYFIFDHFSPHGFSGNSRVSLRFTEQAVPRKAMPRQSYIGAWYTDADQLDDLIISDIGCGVISFDMSIFRTMGMKAIAMVEDNQIKFAAIEGSNTSLSGIIELNQNSILVTFLESEFSYIEAGTAFAFDVRE